MGFYHNVSKWQLGALKSSSFQVKLNVLKRIQLTGHDGTCLEIPVLGWLKQKKHAFEAIVSKSETLSKRGGPQTYQ